MNHTFEDAMAKLDQIEADLSNKDHQKTELDKRFKELEEQIKDKNDRLAQLEKLFRGNAFIFQKQINFVGHLKEKIEKEQQEKGISTEKAQHLEQDIKNLNQQKEELDKRIKEFEEAEKKSKDEKDREIADLKKTIKELTEVKMKREQSEEKLRKQSEEFLKVQQMNQTVYDILGQYSTKTGLLLRSQEVVEKLKKELGWWDKWEKDNKSGAITSVDATSFKLKTPLNEYKLYNYEMWRFKKIIREEIYKCYCDK